MNWFVRSEELVCRYWVGLVFSQNVCNFDMHWRRSHSSAVPNVVVVAVGSVWVVLFNTAWVIGVAAVIVLAPPFAVIGKVIKG